MRDAVKKKPATGTSTEPIAAPSAAATAATVPAPNASAAPVAAAPAPAPAPQAAAVEPTAKPDSVTEVEHRSSVEETAIEQAPAAKTEIVEAPVPTPAPTQVAAPAPLSEDVNDETSAVSSPPPAPALPTDPKDQAQLDELDQKIEAVQGEIAQREESLAALISTPDDQRSTPLVDDPQFREISQRLPKLQADLQTLREQRNKIQPTAATP
jgi:tetrahydromethanopterin S-methyltransferase subunit G